MKKIKMFFVAALSAMILGACSDDKFSEGNEGFINPDAEEGVYMALNIQMPNGNSYGSRSYTDQGGGSDVGIEIGKDYENTVGEAIVVLTNSKFGFIGAATITDKTAAKEGDNPVYITISKFNKTQLAAYYSNGAESGTDIDKVYVFVFCNPNLGLRDFIFGDGTSSNRGISLLDKDWINKAATLIVPSSIWSRNQFLMSNASLAERQIPATLEGWNAYNVEDSPFNLSGLNSDNIDNLTNRGNIKVERSAARFDFRDGSIDGKTDPNLNGIGDNTYEVLRSEDKVDAYVNVQLQKMCLVNMNEKFFFLRRVSNNGTDNTAAANDWQLCGPEKPWFTDSKGTLIGTPGNFVVDADQVWKSALPESGFFEHFNYPFFNEDGTIDNNNVYTPDRWATYSIDQVLSNASDNDNTWNNGQTHKDYKIWRYATENTIAPIVGANGAMSYASQVNGISTGVVFKAQMKGTNKALNASHDPAAQLLAKTLNDETTEGTVDDPILFNYHNNLYVTWDSVRAVALRQAITEIRWNSQGEGYWEFDINRELSLYKAVFDDGGFGRYEFKYKDGNGDIQTDYLEDTKPESNNCCDAAWNAWIEHKNQSDAASYLSDFKKKATGVGFALYERSKDLDTGKWGYYCYYYYWNRHNDNGMNGIMGPMEFCVVRNNVYKLAVTKIKKLGHPRVSENDPDKPTPRTPDENEDVYITVTAEVLPWVVRVNDIEF